MKNKIFIFLFSFFALTSYSQDYGQINGDFSLYLQSYVEDEAMQEGAQGPDEVVDQYGNKIEVNRAKTMTDKERKKAIKEIEKKLKDIRKKNKDFNSKFRAEHGRDATKEERTNENIFQQFKKVIEIKSTIL